MIAQAEALTMRDDARSWHAKHGGFGDLITEVQPIWQIGDHVESRRSVPAICADSGHQHLLESSLTPCESRMGAVYIGG